ncbi:MAG: hypothetical protein H0U74_23355 [Bradymonadaceae bacterium]|nr:hypothetical protein [Lujinxingiaceae bacterium]
MVHMNLFLAPNSPAHRPKNLGWPVLAALVALGGCFPIDDSEQQQEPVVVEAARCLWASLGAASAKPFEDVALTVFSAGEDLGRLFAEVRIEGGDEVYYTTVYRNDDGDHVLIAPFYAGGIEGGPVQLRVMGEDFVCPGSHTLAIGAIARAPGTLAAVSGATLALVEAQAQALGFELEGLRVDDLGDLPSSLVGPAVALGGLDDADNPYTLARIAMGNAPNSAELADGMELAEALLAHVGLLKELEVELEGYRALGEPPEAHRFERAEALSTRSQALCGEGFVRVSFSSAEELSYYMRLAHINSQAQDPRVKHSLDALLLGAAVLGGPVIQAVAAVIGLTMQIVNAAREAFANTLPSMITGQSLDITHAAFGEDSEEQGRWSNYTVVASSRGWNPTAAIFGVVVNAIGSVLAGKQLVDSLGKVAQHTDVIKNLATMSAQNKAQQLLEQRARDAPDEGICIVAPSVWRPVDLTHGGWAVARYREAIQLARVSNTPLEAGQHPPYEPARVGAGTLAVFAEEHLFPGENNELNSLRRLTVNVNAIKVVLEPSHGLLQPGQSLQITSTVFNANDKRLLWDLISDSGTLEVALDGRSATLTAPDDVAAFPVVVRARSRSQMGLRSPALYPQGRTRPEREGHGFYQSSPEVVLLPRAATLRPGDTQQFVAETLGAPDDAMVWSTSGGAIDQHGLFKATDKGVFVVTAKSKSDPKLTASAAVTVTERSCFWWFSVLGPLRYHAAGSFGVTAVDNGNGLALGLGPASGANLQIRSIDLAGAGPGTLGSFEMHSFSVQLSEASWLGNALLSIPELPATLTISAWDDNHHMTADFQGTAVVFKSLLEEDPIFVQVSAHVSTYVNSLSDFMSFANNCTVAD